MFLFKHDIFLAQTTITKYKSLGGLNNLNLFFTVLKVGSPRSLCKHGRVWRGPSSWLWVATFLLYQTTWQRDRRLQSLPFLRKTLIPARRLHPPFSNLNDLPKTPPPNTSHWTLGLQHMSFERYKYSVDNRCYSLRQDSKNKLSPLVFHCRKHESYSFQENTYTQN